MKSAEACYREGREALVFSFTADKTSERDADIERGIEALDAALHADPTHVAAWQDRGLALAWLERFREAAASFSKALRLSPDDPDLLVARARVWHKMGAYDKALAGYDEVFAVRRADADARYWRAEALESLGRHAEATVAWRAWLSLEDDDSISLARRLDRVIVSRRPERAQESEAQLLVQQGRRDEAVAAFRAVLDPLPKPVGMIHPYNRLMHAYDEAVEAYLGYLYEHWDERLSRLHAAKVLCRRHWYVEALQACEAWVELVPDDRWAWYQKASVLSSMGRCEEAAAGYRRALDLDPKFLASRGQLERLEKRMARRTRVEDAPRWAVFGRDHNQGCNYVEEKFTTEAEAVACVQADAEQRHRFDHDRLWILPPSEAGLTSLDGG